LVVGDARIGESTGSRFMIFSFVPDAGRIMAVRDCCRFP
jgi:hypothetical protein